MENQSYIAILRRVGLVLILVGSADVGWMIYCIAQKIAYSSSFNLFAVIAGMLLLRGGLRTAVAVRWFGFFFLSASLALLVTWPAFHPVDLLRTQIRLAPLNFARGAAFLVFGLALLYWVITELGRKPVRVAIAATDLKWRDTRIPAALGVALVIGLSISLHFFLGSESGKRAISIAEQEVGPGYHLHVRSLQVSSGGGKKSSSGVVTAWNDKEIHEIPVHWETRD